MTRSCRFRMYTRPTRACRHLGGGASRDSQKAMIDCGRTADSKGGRSRYFWFKCACQEMDFKSSVGPGTPSQNPASRLAALRQLSRKSLAATAPESQIPLVRLTPSSMQAALSLPAPNRRPSRAAAWTSCIRFLAIVLPTRVAAGAHHHDEQNDRTDHDQSDFQPGRHEHPARFSIASFHARNMIRAARSVIARRTREPAREQRGTSRWQLLDQNYIGCCACGRGRCLLCWHQADPDLLFDDIRFRR